MMFPPLHSFAYFGACKQANIEGSTTDERDYNNRSTRGNKSIFRGRGKIGVQSLELGYSLPFCLTRALTLRKTVVAKQRARLRALRLTVPVKIGPGGRGWKTLGTDVRLQELLAAPELSMALAALLHGKKRQTLLKGHEGRRQKKGGGRKLLSCVKNVYIYKCYNLTKSIENTRDSLGE